jgi:hypothetical protein
MLLTISGELDDAADHLRRARLHRETADLVERDAQIARDVLEKLPRARGALTGHARGQHFAAGIDAHRTGVKRPDVQDRGRLGHEVSRAASMGRHAVKVATPELHQLALAGAGDVGHLFGGELALGQGGTEALVDHLPEIPASDTVGAKREDLDAGRVATGRAQDGGLDRAGPDVDPGCHERAMAHAASSAGSPRMANRAAPRAPV